MAPTTAERDDADLPSNAMAPMPARTDRLAAPAEPLPILTYHNIGTAPDGATHRGLYLSVDKFRFHLDVLARRGWRGVSMDEGLPYLRGERQGKVTVVTFDDGYVDTVELALPALLECGFSATCYLVAERIGASNEWDCAEVRARKPLMDVPRIREWLGAGMKVGSHTLTHPHLPQLDRDEKRREIVASKGVLEDRLGVAVEHLCFPYGDYDADCVVAAADAGYATAVTTERGRVRRGQSLLALPRLGNSGKRSRRVFQARALLWEL